MADDLQTTNQALALYTREDTCGESIESIQRRIYTIRGVQATAE